MSFVLWNNLIFFVVKLHAYKREAQMDGPNYRWTRHVLSVRALLNPAAAAYQVGGQNLPPAPALQPELAAGQFTGPPQLRTGKAPVFSAAASDQALRHQVIQPRGYLLYVQNGVRVLQSPLQGYSTDANNGPKVIAFDILSWLGGRTAVVDLTIEAAISECLLYSTTAPAILTQTFTETLEFDENHYATRQINGRVVFRSDVMAKKQLVPDQFRNQLGHPVGSTMKRDKVFVRQREDGVTLDYVFIDHEKPLLFDRANVTTVNAVQTLEVGAGSVDDLAKGILGAGEGAEKAKLTHSTNPGKAGGLGLGFGLINAGLESLPTAIHTIEVRVWGNRNSTRDGLTNFAVGITAARAALLPVFVGGFHTKLRHDLAGSYVDMITRIQTGPIETLLTSIPLIAIGSRKVFSASDDTAQLLTKNGKVLPTLPNDNGTRGTYQQVLLYNALKGACDVVQPPPAVVTPATINSSPLAAVPQIPNLVGILNQVYGDIAKGLGF